MEEYFVLNDASCKKTYINKKYIESVTWCYDSFFTYRFRIFVVNREKPYEINYDITELNKALKELGLPLKE